MCAISSSSFGSIDLFYYFQSVFINWMSCTVYVVVVGYNFQCDSASIIWLLLFNRQHPTTKSFDCIERTILRLFGNCLLLCIVLSQKLVECVWHILQLITYFFLLLFKWKKYFFCLYYFFYFCLAFGFAFKTLKKTFLFARLQNENENYSKPRNVSPTKLPLLLLLFVNCLGLYYTQNKNYRL